MILLCPPEKSTQFHYPLDPKKIRAEGSMHKDTTYQGSDRQDFYRHGRKKNNTEQMPSIFRLGLPYGNPVTRPSVRVHWIACGTCSVPGNFFQVGGSLRPFKGSPRSHTSRGPLVHRSSHVRTTKQILF